jgi:DNA-binding Lrp family transcriptional regulator
MPTDPSVTIQVVPLSAPTGGVLELPERLRLNFFSILVVTGPKIADKDAICHHSTSSAAASNTRTPRSGATLMRQARLDQTDRRILRELQADGRITNVELARKVGISAPPCLRRVRALEEAGFIRGYAALLDDRALGFDVTAFAMVGLHSQAEVDLVAFEQRVRGSPIVRDCYMLSGEIDFMLKCVAPDLTAFQDFIIHELTAAPNVASVKTSLVIRASKHDPGVPIEAMPASGKTARAGERART